VSVVGVSRDSPYSHLEWARRLGLNFPLLSDWNAEAVRTFGVAQTLDGLADTPVRAVFLADAGGVIRFARRYDDSEVPDVGELLDQAEGIAGAAG
jgi:peroxiredoxin